MKLVVTLLFVCNLVRTSQGMSDEFGDFVTINYYNKDDPIAAVVSDKNVPFIFPNDNLKTVYIIHGWNSINLENPERLKNEILRARTDVGRVAIIDWMNASQTPYGIASAKIAPVVAKLTAEEIARAITHGMSTAANVELIGHSLGAHIAGRTGNLLNSQNVGPVSVITGLDPASLGYQNGPSVYRLQRGCASTVRVIHTNTRLLGNKETLGDEDIWVNGGRMQPECEETFLWLQDKCAHTAAWNYGIQDQLGIPLYDPADSSRGKNYVPPERISINILVLDVSESMKGLRLKSLIISSKRFIRSAHIGSYLGIITFSTSAELTASVGKIINNETREGFCNALPNTYGGGTSIGAGLLAAIKAGSKFVSTGNCPNIILMTDGEENTSPSLAEVQPQLRKSCLRVNAIAFGAQADQKLEKLASDNMGSMYTVSDQIKDDIIYDTLTESIIDASETQLNPDSRIIKLPSKIATVGDPNPVTFIFDNGIGKNTHISISNSAMVNMEAVISGPNGIKYGPWNKENYKNHAENHEIIFEFDDIISGVWGVIVKHTDNSTRKKRHVALSNETATIFVKTNVKTNNIPIRLEGVLSNNTLEYPCWIKIEAVVRKGNVGILNADVTAYLTSPEGYITTMKLRDDGDGADERKNDGIYARFITYLNDSHRYEVKVIATNTRNEATLDNINLFPFERSVNIGSLKAIGTFVKPSPAAVNDLKVINIDLLLRQVTICWSAPGEVADVGTVPEFFIRYTTNLKAALHNETQFVVGDDNVLNQDSLIPLSAGEMQKVIVVIPNDIWEKAQRQKNNFGLVELYFTVQTRNSEFLYSNSSNIGDSFTFFMESDTTTSTMKSAYPIYILFVFILLIIFVLYKRKLFDCILRLFHLA